MGLTLKYYTFFPHGAFTRCSVWFSEQTCISSLYIIHLMVFITESEFVYCPVGNESLNLIQLNLKI